MSQIVDAVRRAVREELILAAPPPPKLPTPCDLEAEGMLLAALLDGEQAPRGMHERDFYSELNRAVFLSLRKLGQTTPEKVADDLEHSGFVTKDIRTYVTETLAQETPYSARLDLLAARLTELRRRRDLCELLVKVDVALRTTDTPVDQIIDRLRDRFGGAPRNKSRAA